MYTFFFLMCFYTRQAKAEHYVYQLILTRPLTDMLSNTLTLKHTHTHRCPLPIVPKSGLGVPPTLESTLVPSHTPNPFPAIPQPYPLLSLWTLSPK